MPLLSVPWGTIHPDLGASFAPEIPKPWAVFRAQGNERLLTQVGSLSGSSISGNSASAIRHGPAVRITSGASLTYTDQPSRDNYAVYLTFRVRTVSGTHTVLALDGGNVLQVRINSSNQLEMVAENILLLATSSYAGFTSHTTHRLGVRMQTGGPIVAIRDGQQIASYASGMDLGVSAKRILFGRRSGAGETADIDLLEAWHWSRQIPSTEQLKRITVDPFNTLYGPIEVPVSAGGGVGNVGSVFTSGVFGSNVFRRAA